MLLNEAGIIAKLHKLPNYTVSAASKSDYLYFL